MFMNTIFTKYGRRIRKNRRELAKLEKACQAEIKSAKEKNCSAEDIHSLERDWYFTMTELWDYESLETSKIWLNRAYRHNIPRPAYDNETYWDDSQWFSERFLTPKGIQQIRIAWRDEIQWRVGIGSSVGSSLIGFGGLIVAMAGILIAFLSKF